MAEQENAYGKGRNCCARQIVLFIQVSPSKEWYEILLNLFIPRSLVMRRGSHICWQNRPFVNVICALDPAEMTLPRTPNFILQLEFMWCQHDLLDPTQWYVPPPPGSMADFLVVFDFLTVIGWVSEPGVQLWSEIRVSPPSNQPTCQPTKWAWAQTVCPDSALETMLPKSLPTCTHVLCCMYVATLYVLGCIPIYNILKIVDSRARIVVPPMICDQTWN